MEKGECRKEKGRDGRRKEGRKGWRRLEGRGGRDE